MDYAEAGRPIMNSKSTWGHGSTRVPSFTSRVASANGLCRPTHQTTQKRANVKYRDRPWGWRGVRLTAPGQESRTKLLITIGIFSAFVILLLLPSLSWEEYVEPEVLAAFDPNQLDEVWAYMEKPANRTWVVLSTYIERHIGNVTFFVQDENGTGLRVFWWSERASCWKWGVGLGAPEGGMMVTMDRYSSYMLYHTYEEHRNDTLRYIDREVPDHIARVGTLFDVFDQLVKRNHIIAPSEFDHWVHATYSDFNAVRGLLSGEYYYNFNAFIDNPNARSVDLGAWGSFSL